MPPTSLNSCAGAMTIGPRQNPAISRSFRERARCESASRTSRSPRSPPRPPEAITVRGRDLCRDLIGKVGFTDYFYFLVTGTMPNEEQRFFTDAVMVAIAEHGLVPSVQAARMTLAAAPGGLAGRDGRRASSASARWSRAARRRRENFSSRSSPRRAATAPPSRTPRGRACSASWRRSRRCPASAIRSIPSGDPRANAAPAARRRAQRDRRPCRRCSALLEKHAEEITGRRLPINVSGAIPAVMLDVGWPVDAMKGLPLLARTAGLVAHLYEEMRSGRSASSCRTMPTRRSPTTAPQPQPE